MDMAQLFKKKKADSEMDPKYKDSKLSVLKHISDMASNSMGDDIANLKKVTVASPDEKGLAMGLDKAKDMVGEEESPEEEAQPSGEEMLEKQIDHEADEGELTPEEIDALIHQLQQKKEELTRQ